MTKVSYYNRAIAKYKLGKYKEAIEDYNKEVKLNPVNVDAYINRGNAKQELEDYRGAIEDYSKAIELDPSKLDAYICRGFVKGQLGKSKEAIEDYNKAIELDPVNVDAILFRSYENSHIGKNKEVIEDCSKLIELEPDNVDHRICLESIYRRLLKYDSVSGLDLSIMKLGNLSLNNKNLRGVNLEESYYILDNQKIYITAEYLKEQGINEATIKTIKGLNRNKKLNFKK